MLFYVKVKVKPDTEADVVLLVKSDAEGGKFYSFKEILGNSETIPHLAQLGDRVYVEGSRDIFPFASIGGGNSPNGSVDYTKIYSFIDRNPDGFTEEQAKIVADRINNPNISLDNLITFKEAYLEYKRYVSGEDKFKIMAPELTYYNSAETTPCVKEYNGQIGPQFKYLSSSINKTSFMETEDDRFFIEIPDYDKLKSFDFPISNMIPLRSEIAKPYPHPIYHTPFYKMYFEAGIAQRKELIGKLDTYIRLSRDEKQDVPKIDFRMVTGYPESTDLELQDNELDYFNALKELITCDITQFSPDKDPEEAYKNAVASSRMLEYLQELVERMTHMNWTHGNNFPFNNSVVDDEDDDNDSKRDSDVDTADFFPTGERPIDRMQFLHNFILAAAQSGMGFDAFIEAIIKLARWGKMKPTMLRLGSYPKYFDLNTFRIRSISGNFSTMKPVTVEGYEMVYQGLILFDEKFRDYEYRQRCGVSESFVSIPVGVVLARFYEGGIKQLVSLSIIDLVNEYIKNPDSKLVHGVSLDGNTFKLNVDAADNWVNLRNIDESVEVSEDRSMVYYESDSARKLMLDYKSRNLSSLKVLADVMYTNDKMTKWYDSMKFSNMQELAIKLQQSPQPVEMYASINVANVLLPIVLLANDYFEKVGYDSESNYDKLFKAMAIYLRVMKAKGYVGEDQFLSDGPIEEKKEEVKSEPASTGSIGEKLKRMSSLGSEKEDKVEEVVVEEVGTGLTIDTDQIFIPIEKSDKLISLMQGNNVVGCVAIRTIDGKKVQILGDMRHVPSDIAPSLYGTSFVCAGIFNSMTAIMSGKPEKAGLKFSDTEVLEYYNQLLTKQFNAEVAEKKQKIQEAQQRSRV